MSTGLDCRFVEREPGEWFLYLEDADGPRLDAGYNKWGPFRTFDDAYAYLDRNFANPGGFSIDPHPDSTDRSWE